MSGDHNVCAKCGAGIFACNCDAPANEPDYVTHNVACCISPEAVAAGKRESYKQGFSDGGKTALDELMRRWNTGAFRTAAHEKLRREFERGEWPPKEE